MPRAIAGPDGAEHHANALATRLASPGEVLLDRSCLAGADAPGEVVESVVELAIEIAREGREGRRVGTLFTVGDHHRVLEHSRCMILDPLAHHPAKSRMLSDSGLRETVKELAQLDGGFVVSDRGIVESAARYFESSLTHGRQHLGLGTRHLAAASISEITAAVGVVVSESSIVRIYQHGELKAEILPELWLLRRFVPHLRGAHLVEHREDNLIVVSGDRDDADEGDAPR